MAEAKKMGRTRRGSREDRESPFLDGAALFELTGHRRKAEQAAWLKEHGHGIQWWLNARGNPVVPYGNFDRRPEIIMTPRPEAAAAEAWQPNALKNKRAA